MGGRDASTVFLCLGVIVGGLIFVIVFCAWCGTRKKRQTGFPISYGFQLVQILSRGRGDADTTLTGQPQQAPVTVTPSPGVTVAGQPQQEPVTVTPSPESPRTNQDEHSPRRSSENINGVTNIISRGIDRSFFTLTRPRATTPAIPSRAITPAVPSRATTPTVPSRATTPAIPSRRVTDNTVAVPSSNAWTDIDLNAMIPSLSTPSTHLSAQHGPPRIAPFVPPPRRTGRPASPTEPTAPLLPPATHNEPERRVRPAILTEPTAPFLPSATHNEPERTVRPADRPFLPYTSQFHAPERVSISSFRDSGSSRFEPPPGYYEIDRIESPESPEDLNGDPLAPPSYDEVMSKPHIYPKR